MKKKEDRVAWIAFKDGKFEFWHDAKYGLLDETGLRKLQNNIMDNPLNSWYW